MDPDTLCIKAVLDLEITNAMPSQFATEAPLWLLLVGPSSYLLRYRTIKDFVKAYEPRLEHFLQVMDCTEKARNSAGEAQPLSSLMRESWATKRFWLNYAARKPFDVKVFFDTCLRESGAGIELLDEEARKGSKPFVKIKMQQLQAYDSKRFKIL